MTPTFEQLPELVSKLIEKVESLEKLLRNNVDTSNSVEKSLNVDEAAKFIDVENVQTIYRMVREDRIPFHKQGSRLHFYKSELTAWIKGDKMYFVEPKNGCVPITEAANVLKQNGFNLTIDTSVNKIEKKGDFPVEDADISVRAFNVLKTLMYQYNRQGLQIRTFGELYEHVNKEDLIRSRGCGELTLNEIDQAFVKHGLGHIMY